MAVRLTRLLPLTAIVLATLLVSSGTRAQARTVAGSVTDAETRAPLTAVNVAVQGQMLLATATNDDGRFSISIPAGNVTLVVRRIGYRMQNVAVAAEAASLAIAMVRDPLRLDEVVVTGHASTIARRNAANFVAVVKEEDLRRVPAATIEQALQGKIAGAQIYKNTGAPGGGMRVLIRGTTSINGSVAPLYVIDGVQVTDRAIAPGLNRVTRSGGGGFAAEVLEDPVNRIADLNPDDIESVEILKGSSAAAMYGSKASGGVVMITTKRGSAGRARVSARTGLGVSQLSYRNGSRRFRTLADARRQYDASNVWGDSVWAVLFDSTRYFDLEEMLYGRAALNHETSFTFAGGADQTRYFASALTRSDQGIVVNTFSNKQSGRLNLDHTLGTRAALRISTNLTRSVGDRGLLGNENAPGGGSIAFAMLRLPSFYDFRRLPDGTYPENRFYSSNPFQTVDLFQNEESAWRSLTNMQLDVQAFTTQRHDVRLMLRGGLDLLSQRNSVVAPAELEFEDDDNRAGTSQLAEAENTIRTFNVHVADVFTAGPWLRFSSELGTQYDVTEFNLTRTLGEQLIGGGTLPLSGATRTLTNRRELVRDFGVFAQTEALLWNRLNLSVGVRADRTSNNGDPTRMYVYPKASVSYRVTPAVALLDEVKLRAAYGETGNKPGFGQRFTNLAVPLLVGAPTILISDTRGSPDIHPERQQEIEGGVDIVLRNGRAEIGLTGYQRNVSELLLNRTAAPSLGYSVEVYNGGRMRARGFEALLNAFPVGHGGSVEWNTTLHFALNRTRVTHLSEPLGVFGSRLIDGQVFVQVGRPVTEMVGSDSVAVLGQCPERAVDPNSCGSLAVGAPVMVYAGDANPRYNAGWSNQLRWRSFTAFAMLDRQDGGLLRSTTWAASDLQGTSRDWDAPSPDSTMRLGLYRTTQGRKVSRVYLQDASYLKLREVTLGYELPKTLARRIARGNDMMRLSASARNLKTWSRYRGGDPEFTNFGSNVPAGLQRNRELAPYPPSRTFWFTVQVGL